MQFVELKTGQVTLCFNFAECGLLATALRSVLIEQYTDVHQEGERDYLETVATAFHVAHLAADAQLGE